MYICIIKHYDNRKYKKINNMKGFGVNKSDLFKRKWMLQNDKKSGYNTPSSALAKAWEIEKQNLMDRQNAAKNEWYYSQYAGFGKSDLDGFHRFSYDINRGIYG